MCFFSMVVFLAVLWSRSILTRLWLQLYLCSQQFVAVKKFHFLIYLGLFYSQKKYECFALLFQYFTYRDRLIYFTLLFNILFISLLKHRSELELELEPEPPLCSRLLLQSKRAAPASQNWLLGSRAHVLGFL